MNKYCDNLILSNTNQNIVYNTIPNAFIDTNTKPRGYITHNMAYYTEPNGCINVNTKYCD